MSHYNGSNNGNQSNNRHNNDQDYDGNQSLPEEASFGKNGSIPEGYEPNDSGPNLFGMALLAALFWAGLIALILLLF